MRSRKIDCFGVLCRMDSNGGRKDCLPYRRWLWCRVPTLVFTSGWAPLPMSAAEAYCAWARQASRAEIALRVSSR